METSGREGARTPRSRARLVLAALPLVLLLVQTISVHHSLVEGNRLRPILVPDSDSYVKLSHSSTVDEAFSHYRTYGYPLLIKTFGQRDLMRLELGLYLAATIAFFAAVWIYAGNAWIGLAAASPLLYSDALKLLGRVQPDFVACAFVLFSVAALLALVVRPRNAALWAVLVAAFFASYQIRPATLFMMIWLPLLGWALAALRDGTWRRPRWTWLAGLLLATALPYLVFASWRAVRIGEFGLVAFGGYNMSGLAASLIDDAMLDELDDPHRRMAAKILKLRRKRGWEPYRPEEGSLEWSEQYSQNVWLIASKVATDQVQHDWASPRDLREKPQAGDQLAINDRLRGLSRDVIRRRPAKYLTWVRDANLYGWRQLAEAPWITWPGGLLLASLVGWWLARRKGWVPTATGSRSHLPAVPALLLLGVSFFGAYIFLISLLSFPFPRYLYGAALLLPGALCGALAALWIEAIQRRGPPSSIGPRAHATSPAQ